MLGDVIRGWGRSDRRVFGGRNWSIDVLHCFPRRRKWFRTGQSLSERRAPWACEREREVSGHMLQNLSAGFVFHFVRAIAGRAWGPYSA